MCVGGEMRVGMLGLNNRCEQICTSVNDKGLLQCKCWYANLSCACFLDLKKKKKWAADCNMFLISSSMSKKSTTYCQFFSLFLWALVFGMWIFQFLFFLGVGFPPAMNAFISMLWEAAESTEEAIPVTDLPLHEESFPNVQSGLCAEDASVHTPLLLVWLFFKENHYPHKAGASAWCP